jgi:diaminopimelate decarboxylase
MNPPADQSRLPVPPAVVDPVARFLAADAIAQSFTEFGSPVNVLFPQVFSANAARLSAVLETRGIDYRICYAHKANRSPTFVASALGCGLDLDVASPAELDTALARGFPPDRIVAGGPKGEGFLRRAVEAGVTVSVDNLWELGVLHRLRTDTPILLRLSGFGIGFSRFGIDAGEVDAALDLVATSSMRLRGLAFHLDSAEVGERVTAIASCLEVLGKAYALGLEPRVLDIGGGLRQAFCADPAPYERYLRALLAGLNGEGPALGWPGHSFGWTSRDGRYRGVPSFHKYGNTGDGPAMLGQILDARLADGSSVADTVRDAMLQLWIEPGKSLLDHAGVTIATVAFVKRLPDGTPMATLDISRDTITPVDQEVLLDPLLLPQTSGEPAAVFLAGRLCLERDMVTRRKVFFDRMPRPGDRLAFVNTAAYQMDLSAAAALGHPLPPKIVAIEGPEGSWSCSTDTSPS